MPPPPDMEKCKFCGLLTWLADYLGHRVCGSAACLNKARDHQVHSDG